MVTGRSTAAQAARQAGYEELANKIVAAACSADRGTSQTKTTAGGVLDSIADRIFALPDLRATCPLCRSGVPGFQRFFFQILQAMGAPASLAPRLS